MAFRTVAADASIYFGDLTDVELQALRDRALMQGRCIESGTELAHAEDALVGSMRVRLHHYERLARSRGTVGREFISNLQQRPTYTP